MADITIRWAGAADAESGSAYRIERTLDGETWAELVGAQAATAPYAPVGSALDGNLTAGAASIELVDASSFASSGYAWIEDALVQWSSKVGSTLSGVVWHSGHGVYASGSEVLVAHESYIDSGVVLVHHAALYRIIHVTGDGNESAPAYLWYYAPPAPASSQHCVVVVHIGADLGVAPQEGVSVQGFLASDNQFGLLAGQHLDANAGAGNQASTNALGLAFFHCWKDRARYGLVGASDAAYIFILKPGTGQLVVTAQSIPDRDWVLLAQIATHVSTTVGT